MPLPSTIRLKWPSYFRIIPSRFPPIDLFERVSPPEDWDALNELEQLTNPRVRQDIGQISLVPVDKRVAGPGASYAMASFVHLSRNTRFSSGDYGVFYAAQDFLTALYEVAYHRGKFHNATSDPPLRTEERVLKGSIDATLHDIRGNEWNDCYHSTDYSKSQKLAAELRNQQSDGIVYNSVRRPEGENFAAFWPNVMGLPIQTSHINYRWNGHYIDAYFDHEKGDWIDLPNLIS